MVHGEKVEKEERDVWEGWVMAPDHVSIIRDVSGIRLVYTRLMNSVILLVRGGERFS